MQTFSTFYTADDLDDKGMHNSKIHYPKRSFPEELNMHVKRNHNAVGGFDQNSTRFLTFYSKDHNSDLHKVNRKTNPETIFETMAKKSRRKFSKNRITGQHPPPPFHMKGIDEARHIPEPPSVQAVIDKRKYEAQTLSPTNQMAAPRLSPSNAFGENDLKALCDVDTEAILLKDEEPHRHKFNKSALIMDKPKQIIENFFNEDKSASRYSGKRSQSLMGNKHGLETERVRKLNAQAKQIMNSTNNGNLVGQHIGTFGYKDKRFSVGDYVSSRHDPTKKSFYNATDVKTKQNSLYDNALTRQMKNTEYANGLAAFDTLPELKSQYNAINARLQKDKEAKDNIIFNQAACFALGQPIDSKRVFNHHLPGNY